MPVSEFTWVFRIIADVLCILLVYIPWIVLQTQQPVKRGFYCDDDSLRYPFKESTVSGALYVFLGLAIPIITILITEGVHLFLQKRQNTLPPPYQLGKYQVPQMVADCYKLIGTFLFGAAVNQTITNILKYSVGRLRPHFFDVCRPDYTKFSCTGPNGLQRYVTEDVCTGTHARRMKEVRLSFPSGHSSLSVYCMVFLVLYLQARFKWKGLKFLRPAIQAGALWLATYISVSRISDYKHHWSDVLGGALLGLIVALITGFFITKLFKGVTVRDILNKLCQQEEGQQVYQVHQQQMRNTP